MMTNSTIGTQVTYAASYTNQKKIVKTVDSFVWSLFSESLEAANYEASDKKIKTLIKKKYNGKLTTEVKSAIAADKATGYQELYSDPPYTIETTSLSKVKKSYTNIFGTVKPKLELKKVKYLD